MHPRFRRLFRIDRGAVDVPAAIADELDFHFAATIDELTSQGWTTERATAEAHRRFGDFDRTRRDLQAIDRGRVSRERRVRWWNGIAQDTRYALRGLRLSPGFTLGVMLTLGLGIGANAMMFGIVDPMLFRTPDYLATPANANRIYVRSAYQGRTFYRGSLSYGLLQDISRDTHSFSQIVGYWSSKLAVGDADAVEERVSGVSASFWQMFPVRPELGRLFSEAEDRYPVGDPVIVLSWPYWQSHFGGQRDVLGSHLRIGRFDYTVIGVAPRDLLGLERRRTIGFVPLTSLAANSFPARRSGIPYDGYNMSWLQVAVERRAGVDLAVAAADLQDAVLRSYQRRHELEPQSAPVSELKPQGILAPIQEEAGPNRSAVTRVGTWLAGVALLVLLIACANVGNLLLARALRRRREIALRLALGVSRGRLLRQLLTESLLLAMLGGALAIGMASVGGGLLRRTMLPGSEGLGTLSDPRTLVFSAVVAVLAAVLCGLAPAAQLLRSDLASALKGSSREGSYQRSRVRITLLVLQGALSVVLLVGAGLFVASLRAVRADPLGYDADRVVYVESVYRGETLTRDAMDQLQQRLVTRAGALPGVEAAARTATVPFYMDWGEDIFVPGVDSASNRGDFIFQAVSGDYFQAMGTRILQGRGITNEDRAGSRPVIVVSESMAALLWPGQNPLEKCVRVRSESAPCQDVIGVAEDIKRGSLREDPGLMYYVPLEQVPTPTNGIFVRTTAPASVAAAEVRRQLQAEMPGTAYLTAVPLSDLVAPEMRSWQLGATLFTVFGGLALLVASIGLYSVVAFTVAQRRQEMGIRVALGATTGGVVRMVVGDAVRVMGLAVGLGLAASLAAARWVEPMLFRTSPGDPVILGGVATTLLIVGVVASLAPAWRAAQTDPVAALKSE
ncbi:MAG: ADOP family duplicated permease [Gemmatimonadales bacterium]